MRVRLKGRFVKSGEIRRRGKLRNKFQNDSSKHARIRDDTSEDETDSDTCTSSTGTEVSNFPVTGRRIVEIEKLANELRSCSDCGEPLHLHNITHEKKYGLNSIFYITCECGVINAVNTSKSHRTTQNSRGMPAFDVNSKAALGMFHSGITHTQMDSFLSTLEITGLHPSSMKAREREISQHIESVAKTSCDKALKEEVSLELDSSHMASNSDEAVECIRTDAEDRRSSGQFKYDMGWQKRGSGRAYDSKSGVGTVIGNKTGKICAYDVRISDCRTCSYHESKGSVVPEHICHKNWTGSSKAMEPDVGCKLVQEIESKGVGVDVVIMDDDTTTMARIRNEIPHEVTKWSDINHTCKHLGSSLYSLQKKHKQLTTPAIKYLQKCFNYAIAQNKGDTIKCEAAILQIVPHTFGCHDSCGPWCGYLKNQDTYKHGTLKNDFTGEVLRQDLDAIFRNFAINAKKIAPAASTKDVESFNNMVSSKAPKRCHFSGSGNLKNRVACAVAQKNIGNTYINKINEAARLSPGKVYHAHALKKDRIRKRQLVYSNTIANKRRKIQKKLYKQNSNSTKELREGTTYKTAVAMNHPSDIQEIPPTIFIPTQEKVTKEEKLQQVFCDIETTSLSEDADIVQISAVCGSDVFNIYITPNKSMTPKAAEVTGLTTQGSVLFYHGSPVSAQPLNNAMTLFINWLDDRAPVIFIGHNFKIFDFPRIIRAMDIANLMSTFKKIVVGGVDTLPLFRVMFPGRDSYKQERLVSDILKETYNAHNAVDDVLSLQKLFAEVNVSDHLLYEHSFSTTWAFNMRNYRKAGLKNANTLHPLIDSKVITKAMATKIGNSGLQLSHLSLAYSRGGKEGITSLLTEKVNGMVRVTNTKRIIDSIAEYFESSPDSSTQQLTSVCVG